MKCSRSDTLSQEAVGLNLADLNVWLVGSEDLREATGNVCAVHEPLGEGLHDADLGRRPPGFLLVEGCESPSLETRRGLEELLASCERHEIPRFLWITASPFDAFTQPILRRFSRVFTVDRGQGRGLLEAGARGLSVLWPGTTIPARVNEPQPNGADRVHRVLWPGAMRPEWPPRWRERIEAILEAAEPHGLLATEPASAEEAEWLLRHAVVTIAADPASPSPHFAPKVAFDAIACGSAVITPHTFGTPFDFSLGRWKESSWQELMPVVENRAEAAGELEQLLADERLRDDRVSLCQDIVAFNHTHGHRIATLASAAGIRVVPPQSASPVPDARADAAHS